MRREITFIDELLRLSSCRGGDVDSQMFLGCLGEGSGFRLEVDIIGSLDLQRIRMSTVLGFQQ